MTRLTAAEEWRAHWRVVAGAGIGVATGYGVFPFVASQFVLPLQAAFGWSRGAQSLTQVAAIIGAFLAPVFGRAVDHFGVRPLALVCMPALAAVYLFLSVMNGGIHFFYALTALAILVGLGTTGIVFTRAVTTCFDSSLGFALAVTRTGVALAAALLPMLIFATIRNVGWRAGYAALAAIVLLGMLTCRRWVRECPRTSDERHVWWHLVVNRKVFVLCVAVAFTIGPVVGLLSQLQPLLTGKGIEPGTAAMLASLLALSVLCGTLLTGYLVDRVWAPLVGCVFSIIPAFGCLLLTTHVLATPAAAFAVVCVGLAQGAELDLAGYMIARYFGIANFASIFGLTIFAIGISSALSTMGFGFLFDRFGNYDRALLGSTAVFFVAGFSYLAMGRYPKPLK
jgi:MFS family permease